MRKNEHPGCSCRQCQRGKHSKAGHAVIRYVNRKLRQAYRVALRRGGEEPILIGTPYTD
jgi:hypothetical protein